MTTILSAETQAADVQAFQTAAEQMSSFLASKGLHLSTDLALDAISVGVGEQSWKALMEKLDVRRPVDGPRYLVNAVYKDNDQLFGDNWDATSPLAAAISAQLERLTDSGWITAISVLDVIDRHTGKIVLSADFVGDLDVLPLSEAIALVCVLPAEEMGDPPGRGVSEAEEWDNQFQAMDFWSKVCSKTDKGSVHPTLVTTLNEVCTDVEFDVEDFGDDPAVYLSLSGEEVQMDTVASLKELTTLAQRKLAKSDPDADPKESGLFHCLQVIEALAFHEDRLAVVCNGEKI